MAKHIDLSEMLSNERPTITINGNKYVVNDEKSNILHMNSEMKKEGLSESEMIDKVIVLLLGKKALKEIEAMGFGVSQYLTIFYALIATVNNDEMDVVEKRFQDQRSK